MKSLNAVLVIGALIAAAVWSATFFVDEREKAIKFRLGKIERIDLEPGIHFQIPLLNNVRKFDARIQTLDEKPERYLTLEKKNVLVDSFVKWKIANVEKFFIATDGDITRANIRLSQIIKDGLRGAFGLRTVQEAVSGEREEIMRTITGHADRQTDEFGIKVVDVRIKRVDLPKEISNSVFARMEAERDRIAKELRSQGSEAAERIQAEADRQRTVLLANANKESQELRGTGDGKAVDIYAKAYGADEDFYSFYRSLEAYRQSFKGQNDLLMLNPGSEFFKHFDKTENAVQ